MPNLATVTAPLRELTRKGVKFEWQKKQNEAFDTLKGLVADAKLLHFFDNNLRTRVIADASPVALGAVLVQFEGAGDNLPRPIAYASKSLTETEKRYCQTEKEALGLVWAVERFAPYLLGRKFELETDHKPLEVIFKPSSRPCARIERWLLPLQSFSYVVKYKKGCDNIADPFSRLVVDTDNKPYEEETHHTIRAIMESAAIDVQELENAASIDEVLGKVKHSLRSGCWNEIELKQYIPFKEELGMIG